MWVRWAGAGGGPKASPHTPSLPHQGVPRAASCCTTGILMSRFPRLLIKEQKALLPPQGCCETKLVSAEKKPKPEEKAGFVAFGHRPLQTLLEFCCNISWMKTCSSKKPKNTSWLETAARGLKGLADYRSSGLLWQQNVCPVDLSWIQWIQKVLGVTL